MAEAANIDVLMAVFSRGRAMQAESQTELAVGKVVDRLRQGFEPGQFSELQEFSYSAGVGGSLSSKAKKAQKRATESAEPKAPVPLSPQQRAAALAESQFDRAAKRRKAEFVDMQPVEYTRVFDTASTLLFQALTSCETLDSIAVVKRKAAGTANSGECYLRLDFTKVLITNLDWKDSEHLVMETGTFIYRELRIRYRPQNQDGSLGSVIESKWVMKRTS